MKPVVITITLHDDGRAVIDSDDWPGFRLWQGRTGMELTCNWNFKPELLDNDGADKPFVVEETSP